MAAATRRRPNGCGKIAGGETIIAFAFAEPQGRYNLRRPDDDGARSRAPAMC